MEVCFLLVLLLDLLTFSLADIPPFHNNRAYQEGELGPYPRQTFFSDLEILAPVANVIVEEQYGSSSASYVTWAAHAENITTVPQLLDAKTLSVVYQGPHYNEDTFGFTVQTCNNTDYLVWWAGDNIDGRAAGNIYILNSTYHMVWNVSSVDLEYIDAHDVYLTDDCHVVFTAYQSRPFDLQEYGSDDFPLTENSWLMDSYFQEIDLATNELVFQWRATDHIDLHDSYWLAEIESQGNESWHGWDFFHINSVQKDFSGNFLISARHTSALYYIDGVTGNIIWTLGGPRNEFIDLDGGRALDFSWQHDARWIDGSLTAISLFDDRSCGYFQPEDPVSRGIIISLDYDNMTAWLAREYRAPDYITAVRKGGMHYLDNGNVVLGYGSEPGFTEFAPNGTILWDVRLGPVMKDIDRETADNYRAYKLDWVGEPYWSPNIAPGPSYNGTPLSLFNADYEDLYADLANDTVYFSWNGATRLAKWLVLAAHEPTKVISTKSVLRAMDKTGFEDGAFIGDAGPYVCAIALDKHDRILGVTPLLNVETGTSTAIEDTAGSLLHQYTTFKKQWRRSLKNDRTVIKAIGLVAVSLIIALAIFAWCRCNEFGRLLSRVLNRRGYQAVSPADEVEKQIRPRRRDFSASSAVDPATALMAHELTSNEQDVEQEIGERRTHVARGSL
ncbi:hypothetical protein OHC33_004900 [Knufia fluminis]|uniref:ASST-domain-containing protein n=1 Tax=Knufia fluminis TaxID=191047 RepID=A0AAN8EMJ5_9EURO|nr:hypothetical protein OHC33_004900 [Knufia fluminis]